MTVSQTSTSMIVRTAPRGRVLNVVATGEVSLDDALKTFLEVVSAVAENKSEKILFDGRTIKGDPSIIERFYYGEFAADAVISYINGADRADLDPQFAYVLREPVLDPLRLGETVAANRGMNVKAFDNMEDATEWLGLSPDEVLDFD